MKVIRYSLNRVFYVYNYSFDYELVLKITIKAKVSVATNSEDVYFSFLVKFFALT